MSIRSLLKVYQKSATKYGQNFVIDPNIALIMI